MLTTVKRYYWQEVHDAAHTFYLVWDSEPECTDSRPLCAKHGRAADLRHLPCDLSAGIGVEVARRGSKEAYALGSRGCLSGRTNDTKSRFRSSQVDGEMTVKPRFHHAQHQPQYEEKVNRRIGR